jgi:hypothetical protein
LRLRPLLMLLPLLLAGCGFFERTVGPDTDPRASTNPIDGSYQGRVKLVREAPGAVCPLGRRGVVLVGDHLLVYPWTDGILFSPEIAPDGSVHGTSGDAVMDGRVVNNHLFFTITTPACQSQFKGHFVWNHS